MQIVEVKTKSDWKLFHQVPKRVYKDDPNWIAPLEAEIRSIFDPKENKAFNKGVAKLYVLLDDQGKPAGRIAAFVDYERNETHSPTEGGFGFFECINNAAYAAKLINTAEEFIKSHKVQVIDAPINFGERDKFWGLLERGFDPPLYQENYNPPYYKQFFIDNGYQGYEQILTYLGKTKDIPFDRLSKLAQRLKERNPVYEVKPFSYKEMDKFAKDFTEVYNASFGEFEHFHPVTEDLALKMMEQAKPILDPNLACIAYYEGKPAGFVILYPDINPLLKFAKGKLNWRTIPYFLWKKKRTKTFNAKGLGYGIHPEYKSKGIFVVLTDYISSERNSTMYPLMYLATIRAHNHAIRSVYLKLGVKIDRVHVSYRKAIDPEVEVVPFEFQTFDD